MTPDTISNADVVIIIDRRGVPRVVKHRTLPVANLDVKVEITHTPAPIMEKFSSPPRDTLGLDPDPDVTITVTEEKIPEIIDRACDQGAVLIISGTRVDGTPYENRRVEARFKSFNGEVFHCWDLAMRQKRSFRIDGIESVKVLG